MDEAPPPPVVWPKPDHPVLHFSEVPQTDNNTEIALRWAHAYGVLGLEGERDDPEPRGGEKDTVRAFCKEAFFAHQTLRLYETATDPDGVDEILIATHCDNPFQADDISAAVRCFS
jgi:hypothetical protein